MTYESYLSLELPSQPSLSLSIELKYYRINLLKAKISVQVAHIVIIVYQVFFHSNKG